MLIVLAQRLLISHQAALARRETPSGQFRQQLPRRAGTGSLKMCEKRRPKRSNGLWPTTFAVDVYHKIFWDRLASRFQKSAVRRAVNIFIQVLPKIQSVLPLGVLSRFWQKSSKSTVRWVCCLGPKLFSFYRFHGFYALRMLRRTRNTLGVLTWDCSGEIPFLIVQTIAQQFTLALVTEFWAFTVPLLVRAEKLCVRRKL